MKNLHVYHWNKEQLEKHYLLFEVVHVCVHVPQANIRVNDAGVIMSKQGGSSSKKQR